MYVTWKGDNDTSVHQATCGHLGKHQEGHWSNDERYTVHQSLEDADRYAEEQGRGVKHCRCTKMITMPVAELKAQFSKVLAAVRRGERIGVLYGKAKEPVAMIVPYEPVVSPSREVGFLDGKVRIEFMDDFEMTEAELLGIDE